MAIAATQAETPAAGQTRKPLMTSKQILFMNFGFFGVQYSEPADAILATAAE